MPKTAETATPGLPCRHCALTLPTARALDRHVALDHVPAADGALVLRLITEPGPGVTAGPGPDDAPSSRATAGATGRGAAPARRPGVSPSSTTAGDWWRVGWPRAVVAGSAAVIVVAADPVLATTLACLGLLLVVVVREQAGAVRRPGRPSDGAVVQRSSRQARVPLGLALLAVVTLATAGGAGGAAAEVAAGTVVLVALVVAVLALHRPGTAARREQPERARGAEPPGGATRS